MDIIINGITLQGDFMDADFIAPYEAATRKMQAAAEANRGRQYASTAEGYLEQCRVVDEYFDNIFGAGTAARVFQGTEHNIMAHLEAVEQLTEWAHREKKRLNDFTNKYTQRQNAQAQRARARQAGGGKGGGRWNLLVDGLPGTVEVCGKEIPIETSFRTGILFEEMLSDDALDDAEKLRTALALYFPGTRFPSPGAQQEALERISWFYRCGAEPGAEAPCGGDGDGGNAALPFSYPHDAGYIYAAFLQAYHMDLARLPSLHWWQFRALLLALPEDTQFMKIIGYRTMKLPAKMPKEQKQFYQRMKRLYALPQAAGRQQLETDLSTLLLNGGNPAALLAKGGRLCQQTEP